MSYINSFKSWQNIKTSLFSLTGIMVNKMNQPKMAASFRLVNYYHLPIMYIYIYDIYIYDIYDI